MLDLLLARGENINRVVVIYLASSPRYQDAFRILTGEFIADQYAGRECHLRSAPIRIGAEYLGDIHNNRDVEIARLEIQRLLSEFKAQGQQLHIGLSGGRRILAMLLLSAAMQYLTPIDSIWHIFTPAELLEKSHDGALMHAPPGLEVQLLQVPFVPWVSYFPGLEPLLRQSSQDLGEARYHYLDHSERARCAQVWNALTTRQREVLSAFAAGHQRKAVADQLFIDIKTVDSHREAIAQECSKVWGLEQELRFDTHFLRERFGPFLAGQNQV